MIDSFQPNKSLPFGYLELGGKQDICESWKVYKTLNASEETVISNLPSQHVNDLLGVSPAFELLFYHPEASVRYASLYLKQLTIPNPDVLLCHLESLAFDDNDARVRGLALRVLSHFGLLDDDRFVRKTLIILQNRFQIQPDLVDKTVTLEWLHAIEAICVALEDNELYAEYRKTRRSNEMQSTDLSDIEAGLESPDFAIRQAAILAIDNRLGLAQEQYLEKLEQIVAKDPSDILRMAALGKIISHFSKTTDRRVIVMLARIVLNSSLTDALRLMAYDGIFQVTNAPLSESPLYKRLFQQFRFPEDVDWKLVQSYLKAAS